MDLSVFLHYIVQILIVSIIVAAISFSLTKFAKLPELLDDIVGIIFVISMASILISLYFITPSWTVEKPF